MYKIYAIKGSTTTLIYNDVTPELTTTKLIDPKLSLSDNAAGSLSFKIPKKNSIYNTIEPMVTTIRITRDGNWLWTGRVLTIKKDFWLQKEVTSEGALAFLNDVALPLQKWTNVSTFVFVQNVLNIYNSHVPANRQILAGSISTSTSSGNPIGNHDYISTGESPLKHLSTLAEDWGLHMRIRETNGVLYLDMLRDNELPTNNQTIDFGKNLLDYVDETDWSDLITVVHPYGKELETHNTTGDEEYPDRLTIAGKTPSDTSTFAVYNNEYLYNKAAVAKFGRIEETVEWSEVEDADTLIKLAELYLSDFQYSNIKLTVKVIDLHYMTKSTQPFAFLSKVVCKSRPHNLNDSFIIDKMDIPLDKPENTQFSFSRCTMGYYTSDRPAQGFGKGTVSGMALNVNTFSKASLLSAAKENAKQMIYANTQGYISLNLDSNNDHVENLTITNTATQETSTQRWIWNMGGLMYQERSSINSEWSNPNLALTMDGHIVANMITTGVLQVSRSGEGVLFSADMTNTSFMSSGFRVMNHRFYSVNYYDGTDQIKNEHDHLTSRANGIYVSNEGMGLSGENTCIVIQHGRNNSDNLNSARIIGGPLWNANPDTPGGYDEREISLTYDCSINFKADYGLEIYSPQYINLNCGRIIFGNTSGGQGEIRIPVGNNKYFHIWVHQGLVYSWNVDP